MMVGAGRNVQGVLTTSAFLGDTCAVLRSGVPTTTKNGGAMESLDHDADRSAIQIRNAAPCFWDGVITRLMR